MPRRRQITLLGLILALALAGLSAASGAQAVRSPSPGSPDEIAPGVVLVRFKASAGASRAAAIAAAQGAVEEDEIRPIRVRKLRVPPGREREVAARLQADPAVEFAEVASPLRALWTPDDVYYASSQWGLPKINLPEAWNVTRGNPSVVVAVIDSGLDVAHPDRPVHLRLGRDYVEGGTVVADPNGHGTHVAGIVAANTDNDVGVAGVAPNATLLAIRVLDATGKGWPWDAASAILDAVASGAKVINLSFGGEYNDPTLRSAVEYAQSKGALVVAAAGNYPLTPPLYPAALPGVLAVAATDSSDQRAPFSHVGDYVGVAAPGVAVYSTCPSSRYCWSSGTSMAAPHVAGLAALLWSHRPDLTAAEVASIVKSTAAHLPAGQPVPNDQLGYGRIDAAAALGLAPRLSRTYLPFVQVAP